MKKLLLCILFTGILGSAGHSQAALGSRVYEFEPRHLGKFRGTFIEAAGPAKQHPQSRSEKNSLSSPGIFQSPENNSPSQTRHFLDRWKKVPDIADPSGELNTISIMNEGGFLVSHSAISHQETVARYAWALHWGTLLYLFVKFCGPRP